MRSDLELLRDYTQNKSEESFALLVERHLDLIYSAALRQVRSPELAEEVAQSAFVDLAKHAHQLAPNTILPAWLYQVTRRTAIDVVRREARRRAREKIAADLNAMNASEWTPIEPFLDEAMDALDEGDRAAILLRYFENKSLREVGQALGTSDDAAQKRVRRAIDRLREYLSSHGVTVSATGLAGLLSVNTVLPAPAALRTAMTAQAAAIALSIPVSTGITGSAALTGKLLPACRGPVLGAFGVAVILSVTSVVLYRSQEPRPMPSANSTAIAQKPQPSAAALANNQAPLAAERETLPDPMQLLMGVARARQRIISGSLALDVSVEHAQPGRKETNRYRLVTLFDGSKLRYEQSSREFSYKYSEDEAEAQAIQKRADSMDRNAAVEAGLLQSFEARYVTASDGATLFQYSERQGSTTVDDPRNGSARSSAYFFPPPCLGLRTSLWFDSTFENCLGYADAKSIKLLGQESLDGISTWHILVHTKHDELLDFWIDVARPQRLLKQARGNDFALSRYDDSAPEDPIPVEVSTMISFPNGTSLATKLVRANTQFNVAIDPDAFSMKGLGMKIGTDVIDARIRRRIGYWTGAGLSENLPPAAPPQPERNPSQSELQAVLEFDPASPEALDAAIWFILNSPDGPVVEKSAKVILQEHTHNPNLASLCQELERVRHRCAKPLLRAILQNNPSADVRAIACFTLATLLKDDARYGADQKATAEAEKQFARVIDEFGQRMHRGQKFEELAKPELNELRRLFVGKPAPDIEGHDLDGRPLRLRDFRGKVVVLTFWWPNYTDAPDHRKLVERMTGKPFAFIGVYGDDDLAKAQADVEKYGISWPSFRDRRNGPISRNWNVKGWPDVWVLDRRGTIRHRGLRGLELTQAVEALVSE